MYFYGAMLSGLIHCDPAYNSRASNNSDLLTSTRDQSLGGKRVQALHARVRLLGNRNKATVAMCHLTLLAVFFVGKGDAVLHTGILQAGIKIPLRKK